MKEEGTVSNSTFMTNSLHSFDSNSCAKYGGIIEQSTYKKTKVALSQLFNYVYSIAPPFATLHMVVTVFRILQFVGPALCAQFSYFWSTDDYAYQTVGIISVFYQIVPPNYRVASYVYFSGIYIAIYALFIIICGASAFYFKQNANLPTFLPPFIAFFVSSLGYLLYPIAFAFGFGQLGRIIFDPNSVKIVTYLVLFIVSVLISLAYFWIFISIASRTLLFRYNSLMTATTLPQNIIFVASIVVGSLTGFAATSGELKPYFLFITALVYLLSAFSLFIYGGIIQSKVAVAYFASCITGFVFTIIVGVMHLIKKKGSLLFLAIFALIWIVSYFAGSFLWSKIKNSHLQLLDLIMDDQACFDNVKNVNKMVSMAITGFQHAHPTCINWLFFKLATDKWPNSPMAWFIFAKFVAIYPEETQKLAWIFHTIITLALHGSDARTVKEQSLQIARQRESNISVELKAKLNSISKHLASTKHKLRHVWDMVIQGNIAEMESATKRAIKEIDQSDAEFMHLFRQFPNNRFVTRNYARFCKEVKADQPAYNDMLEKTRLLQRGITVNADQAHELGIAAFPDLPNRIQASKDSSQFIATESISTSTNETLENEEELTQDMDQTTMLKNRILDLSIPATKYTIVIRLLMFVVFAAIPIIAMLVYIPYFIDDIIQPLNYMYYLAYIRTYIYQMSAFEMQYIYQTIGVWEVPKNTTTKLPKNLGNSWDVRVQLYSILTAATTAIQKMGAFRHFNNNNPHIVKGQDMVFSNNIKYTFYESPLNSHDEDMNLQSSANDFIMQLSILLANTTLAGLNSTINSSIVNNIQGNTQTLGNILDEVLVEITKYIQDTNEAFQKAAMYIMIGVVIFIVIVFFVALILQIRWLQSTKEEVYKCLTSLPKNTVSSLAENLRVLKKENDEMSTTNNSEMNKQEDNILKIFVTGGNDSSSNLVDRVMLIFSTVLFIGLHIGCTVSICQLMQFVSERNAESSPHLNYLQGAYAMNLGALSIMMLLTEFNNTDVKLQIFDIPDIIAKFEDRVQKARDYYHHARYGGEGASETPYLGFDDGLEASDKEVYCADKYAVPTDFADAVRCYNADIAFILVEAVIRSRVKPWRSKMNDLVYETLFGDLWGLLVFPIWDVFIAPMFLQIVPTIKGDLTSQKNAVYPGVIAMLVIIFIAEMIAIFQTKMIEKHIREVLQLLLHCPPHIVLQTPKIMFALSGDFSKHRGDSATRDAEFFEAVVQNLPDSIICANTEMVIEAVNKSCARIYSIEDEELIGKKLRDFFDESKFTGNITALFTNIEKGTNEQLSYHKSDGTEVHLNVSLNIINQKYVLSTRDITQTVRYNTLIREEKTKSDFLLASILPPSLVPRVQAGEKNISFAVQSASIVFMDIVSFTPWCGSLPADKVMSTLNNLFKKFDSLVAKYPTMTKIKCIGDCYMAAGGVFVEVNLPAEHAKEMVSFGLDALDAVGDLNQEIDESLQIRVGINTGGPIVAGVLGTEKPTFEILGPAINMAQQMEHHGVPMKVHVSRSVYELIYGDNFVIKERGSVEVKGGSVITYLVSRK